MQRQQLGRPRALARAGAAGEEDVLAVDGVLQRGRERLLRHVKEPHDPGPLRPLARTMWFMIVTFTTVGYGDVSPVNNGEVIFATLAMIIGGALYGYVVALFATLMQGLDPNERISAADALRMLPGVEKIGALPEVGEVLLPPPATGPLSAAGASNGERATKRHKGGHDSKELLSAARLCKMLGAASAQTVPALTQQIDALRARNFGVEIVLLRHFS